MPWIKISLVLVLVLLILAVKYLPWWGLLLIAIVFVFGWRHVAALIFFVMVRKTAREMAKTLHGADVEVHSLKAVSPPDPSVLEPKEEEMDEDDEEFEEQIRDMEDEKPEERDWYELDITIRPQASEDAHWQVEALLLVEPGAGWGEYDATCIIARTEFEAEGRFQPSNNWTAHEAARVRLLFGVTPGTKRLKFRYYGFEEFGDELELPPPADKPAKT